jgi:hypothetical protein
LRGLRIFLPNCSKPSSKLRCKVTESDTIVGRGFVALNKLGLLEAEGWCLKFGDLRAQFHILSGKGSSLTRGRAISRSLFSMKRTRLACAWAAGAQSGRPDRSHRSRWNRPRGDRAAAAHLSSKRVRVAPVKSSAMQPNGMGHQQPWIRATP